MTRILDTHPATTTTNAPVKQPAKRARKSRQAKVKAPAVAITNDSLATTGAAEQGADDGQLTSADANMPTDPKPDVSLSAIAPQETIPSRTPTKTAMVIEALRSKDGVTIDTIMAMTDWQAHSVRGFLSGTVKKKLGLTITRSKDADGQQRYRIVEPASDVMPQDASSTNADTGADASGEEKASEQEGVIFKRTAGDDAHGGDERRDDDGGDGKLNELPEAPDDASDAVNIALQPTEG